MLSKQFKKIIQTLKNPPLSTTFVQNREIKCVLDQLGPDSKILNIGSKETSFSKNVLNLDIRNLPNVQIIGDTHKLPFRNDMFNGIIITAVLEIVKNPATVVTEIHRVLKNKGIVLATLPFLQPYHPDPTDFQRFTKEGVENLFSEFKAIKILNTRGPFSMFIWILRDFLAIVFSFNNALLLKLLKIILGWFLFPLKFIDFCLPEYKNTHFISSSFLYIGEK